MKAFRTHDPSVRSLRDVTLDLLREHRAELEPVVFRRCEYVVGENIRVGDTSDFGQRPGLISLRDEKG